MKPQEFNSKYPIRNESWTARQLGLKLNTSPGPDAIGNNVIVEVKFTKKPNQKRYYKWHIQEHQVLYPKAHNMEAVLALGFYTFDNDISEIQNIDEIDETRVDRTLYLVNWDWINQFQANRKSVGKTKTSQWDNRFRYLLANKLPEMIAKFEVEGGEIFAGPDVDIKLFPNLYRPIYSCNVPF